MVTLHLQTVRNNNQEILHQILAIKTKQTKASRSNLATRDAVVDVRLTRAFGVKIAARGHKSLIRCSVCQCK